MNEHLAVMEQWWQ